MNAAGERRIRAKNTERILRSATKIFAAKGFEGTRIAEIAEAAGLPKANVYYYFARKEDIYRRIISTLIASWDDAMALFTPDSDPATAFRAYVRAKLEYSRRFPTQSRLFATEVLRGGDFLTAEEKRHIREVTDRHARIITGWIDDGKIHPVDPYHLLISIWATTEFYADFEATVSIVLGHKPGPADFEEANRTFGNIVLRGLGLATD